MTSGPGNALTLRAAGDRTEVAGFAARFADDAGRPDDARWHPIALTNAGDDVPWRALPSGTDAVVVAVACLGGQAPTGVLDVRTVRAGGAAGPGPPLAAPEYAEAARHACVYPRAG